MKITKISAKNFYSFRKLELDLSKYNGLVKITGKNLDSGGSNGSGKSTLFEAISFGLFGKPVKRSTEESLVNTQAGKDCEVSIHLEKEGLGGVEIVRTKRPTSLNFFVNGVNKNKESASETQKLIEELLQTDYKSFLTSVAFGQHTDLTFLDSSSEDKRNIIRSCFNLDEFFSKRNAVKELKSGYTAELKTWNTLLESLKNDKKKLENEIPDKKVKFIDLPDLSVILDAERCIQAHMVSIRDISDSTKANSEKLKKLESQIKLGAFESSKECPVCKAPYLKCQTDDDLVKLEFEAKALRSSIQFNKDSVVDLSGKIAAIKPIYTSQEWAKVNEKNKLVLEAQAKINALQKVLDQIAEREKRIQELTQKIEVLKFWELAFSEKGIVRYIIRNILEYFNLRSNEYLSTLTNNQFTIEFNDELAETIKNNGVEVRFISLSGGESKKINLAVMFALQDLCSKISKTDFNLMFLDEICDSLDDKSVESTFNLLNLLSSKDPSKIFCVISHNKLFNELLSNNQEIQIVKSNNISNIVI